MDFLLFYLILRLSPHIHLFFQLSSCTGWSTIRDFRFFQKTAFLPFLGPLPFSWGVFFDKISSPPLFLTANRVWERWLTAIITLQSPPKNWQISVTKYWKPASFMTDTVNGTAERDCFLEISLGIVLKTGVYMWGRGNNTQCQLGKIWTGKRKRGKMSEKRKKGERKTKKGERIRFMASKCKIGKN